MLSGGCLCGAIQYELVDDTQAFYLCHCAQCRKVTGSAFAANLMASPTSIRWTQGEALLQHYQDSERDFSKTFCTRCGSGLPHLNRDKTTLVVPAGSLDSNLDQLPQANIFAAEKAHWLEQGLQAKNFKGFPK